MAVPQKRIRRYRTGDVAATAALLRRAILETGARYYSAEQVPAWAGPDDGGAALQARLGDGRLVLVAEDEAGGLLGFCDMGADGHIDLLHVAPEAVGTGVAADLYDRIEEEARRWGFERLYVEASEPARRFFLKHGFAILRRNDFKVRGVAIHNFAMEKRL